MRFVVYYTPESACGEHVEVVNEQGIDNMPLLNSRMRRGVKDLPVGRGYKVLASWIWRVA